MLYATFMHSEIVIFPYGVADTEENIAYISTANGTAAIQLDSGVTLWQRDGLRWPLWKVAHRLVVFCHLDNDSVLVQLLDLDKKEIVDSMPLRIPASDSRSLMQSTEAPQVRMKGNLLYVRWMRTSRYVGGANPPVQITKSGNAQFVTVMIDFGLRTAKSTSEWPTAVDHCGILGDGSRVVFMRRNQDQCDPWVFGSARNTLEKRKNSFVLVTKSNKSPERRTVIPTSGLRGEPLVTDDGSYIIVAVPEAIAVYSVRSGQLVTDLNLSADARDLSLIGHNLFFLSRTGPQLYLSCVTLPEGKLRWRREISIEPPSLPAALPK